MVLWVGVLARYQNLLRFLWLKATTSDVVVHQYTRHVIGARDSIKERRFIKTPNCAKDTRTARKIPEHVPAGLIFAVAQNGAAS